jgi:hypothetical protein
MPAAVGLQIPGSVFQVGSSRDSLHCAVMATPVGGQKHGLFFERRPRLRRYHHGAHFNALGFGFGFLPVRDNGGDYLVPPHAGVSIPLWFVIGVSAGFIIGGFYCRRRN